MAKIVRLVEQSLTKTLIVGIYNLTNIHAEEKITSRIYFAELIVVMVMIAVIAGFFSSGMMKSLKKAKLRAVSKDLVSAIRYTRGQAVVKHEQKTITFNVENKTYKAPRKKTVEIPDEIEMFVYTAESEIPDESSGSIRFFSDGSSTGGWVKLIQGEKIWKINVNWLTGEIAMVEGTSS